MPLGLCAPRSGDHVLVSDDLYGGTYRLFSNIYTQYGLEFDYVDLTDTEMLAACRRTVRFRSRCSTSWESTSACCAFRSASKTRRTLSPTWSR